ncbi:MAG TPA: DEAD/DEAH box helicase, partial [Thiotrichales bacterium]|nr:DEAD/DEAH box helicase [Thiotrichales bacterium]
GRGPRVVVLCPTRELAQQASKAAMMFAGKLPRMKTVCVTGGEPFRDQLRNIGMPHEIIVATPGRLLDHISRGKVDLSRVEMFVLDEADRMLDMGFSDDVQAIGDRLPKNHQTICFSATFDDSGRT